MAWSVRVVVWFIALILADSLARVAAALRLFDKILTRPLNLVGVPEFMFKDCEGIVLLFAASRLGVDVGVRLSDIVLILVLAFVSEAAKLIDSLKLFTMLTAPDFALVTESATLTV